MTLWFIALPCIFGAIILASILACCFCPCSPEKATQREDDHGARVIEVVLYPDSTTEEARNGQNRIITTTSTTTTTNNHNRHPHAMQNAHHQRYYYPLQAGEPSPVTAVVAGTAPTRSTEPFVGTVVEAAAAGAETRAARRMDNSIRYGEAVYVSAADSHNSPTSQVDKEGERQ